jgi:hypothetical protein
MSSPIEGAKIIPFPKNRKKKQVRSPEEHVLKTEQRAQLSEFYIHAVLQAARAHSLGLDTDSAKSWGLNRAIFYEAAKKGYFGYRARKPDDLQKSSSLSGTGQGSRFRKGKNFGVLYEVGNEKAYAVQEPYTGGVRFVIGGKVQKPETFDRLISKKFPNWDLVWAEAKELMSQASPHILKSAHRFHKDIYKARREDLAQKWSQGQAAIVQIRSVVR